MTKEQLLHELAEAFEQIIATATEAAHRNVTRQGDRWGPREVVAHLAGWEVMNATAGMQPLECADEARQIVMDNAVNAAMVTLIGDQSLDTLCGLLRQAYQRDIEILRKLDDTFFHPGEYVYERTKAVLERCQEHMEGLVPNRS